MHLGVVGEHRLGDALEHDGLARLGRGDDQRALPLAQGRDDVEHPGDHLLVPVLELDPLDRVDAGEVVEVGEPRSTLGGAAVHRVHALDQALLSAHLRHGGQVLALTEPELLHQVLGDLRVLGAGEQVPADLPEEGVGALGLGVQHALHRREGWRRLGLRWPRCAGGGLRPLARLGLLLLARLPLLQLLGREEDLGLLPVGPGQHPVRLPLGGEEDRSAAATATAPAAAASGTGALAGAGGRCAARSRGRAGGRLAFIRTVVVRAVVSVGRRAAPARRPGWGGCRGCRCRCSSSAHRGVGGVADDGGRAHALEHPPTGPAAPGSAPPASPGSGPDPTGTHHVYQGPAVGAGPITGGPRPA